MRKAFVSLLLLASCSDEIKVPKTILQPVQMQAVLWDMVRADETVNHQAQIDSSYKRFANSAKFYQSALAIHHVSERQFKESFHYYEQHPDAMKVVLDSLQAQVNRAPVLLTIDKFGK